LTAVRSALDAQIGASQAGLGGGHAAANTAGASATRGANATAWSAATWSAAHTIGAALLIGALGAAGLATWHARTPSVASTSVSPLTGSPLNHSPLTDKMVAPSTPVDEPRKDEKRADEGTASNADVAMPRSPMGRGLASDPRAPRAPGRARSKGEIPRETAAEMPGMQPPAPPATPSPAAAIAPAPVTTQPAAAAAMAPQAAEIADSLAEEVRLLRAARAALDRAEPSRALASLDEHGSHFPRGTLYEERLATRVLALCAMGRVDAARLAAQELERAAPRSPHLGRVRASCIALPATP
jgi:hypothetical protein